MRYLRKKPHNVQNLTSPLFFFVIAQQLVFDGFVSTGEWRGAQQFSIPYEIEPSDNGPTHFKTEVFVHLVGNDLFVGGSQGYGEGKLLTISTLTAVNCILNFNIFLRFSQSKTA